MLSLRPRTLSELYSRKGVFKLLEAQNCEPGRLLSRVCASGVPGDAVDMAGKVVLGIACSPPKILLILLRIFPPRVLELVELVIAGWLGFNAAAIVAACVIVGLADVATGVVVVRAWVVVVTAPVGVVLPESIC